MKKAKLIFNLLLAAGISANAGIKPATTLKTPLKDPLFSYQWGLQNNNQIILREAFDDKNIPVLSATNMTTDINALPLKLNSTKVIKVAVIDSGVDREHPDLKANLFRNTLECDAEGNQPFKPTEDKDKNGYIGDCMGWNVLDDSPAMIDDVTHGTHVAGIISAVQNNEVGGSGVSNQIKIIPIKVTSKDEGKVTSPNDAGNANSPKKFKFEERIQKAMKYAIDIKADVINLSIGWPIVVDNEKLQGIFKEALEKGITIVAASGNNNHNGIVYPCTYNDVICVGASSIDGEATNFSNYGGHVDMLAPGEEILSTIPTVKTPEKFPIKGYDLKNGSSQAAPFVSAAAALLKIQFDGISIDEIKARLFSSSTRANSVVFKKNTLNGILNVQKSMTIAETSVVRPNFKSIHNITAKDHKISFNLPIKNYWKAASAVKIEVNSLDENIVITSGNKTTLDLIKGQTKVIPVTANIRSYKDNSEFDYTVTITEDAKSETFVSTGNISRNIVDDPQLIKIPIVTKLDLKDVSLNTVKVYNSNENNPEYFNMKNIANGAEKSIQINFFKLLSGKLVQQEDFLLNNSPKLTQVLKVDVNGDSKNDYFMSAIVEIAKKKYVQYTLLDDQQKNLSGNANNFLFLPTNTVIDEQASKVLKFLNMGIVNGKKIKLPVFRGFGTALDEDLNPDGSAFESNEAKARIYYMTNFTDGDKMMLKAKVYDNYSFYESLRATIKSKYIPSLHFQDDVSIEAILPQNDESLKRDQVQILISAGSVLPKKFFVLNVTSTQMLSNTFDIRPINMNNEDISGHSISQVTEINGNVAIANSGISMNALYKSTSGRALFIDSQYKGEIANAEVKSKTPQDQLTGFMMSMKSENDFFTFFESKSNIVLNVLSNGKSKTIYKSIKRNSIIPGTLFSELLSPIIVKNDQTLSPSVFVDSTLVSANVVYAWTYMNGDLISPINLSVTVPPDCRAVTPQQIGAKAEYSFLFLCKKADGFEVQAFKALNQTN